MVITVPDTAIAAGFHNQATKANIGRTILLPELRLLLGSCSGAASVDDFRRAIVEDNALLKATATTRRDSFNNLRSRYALDRGVVLFRALRDFWNDDPASQPLIALLCALARDPLLRSTVDVVLSAPLDTLVTSEMLANAIATCNPARYKPETLREMGQRAGASWAQAGYLQGRVKKHRIPVTSRPNAVAYALLLGYLCGERGAGLFDSFWARVLDAPIHLLREQATVAARHGWIDFRQAGGITEVGFRHLLRDRENEA